jgi:hypothetical protein
MSVTIAAAIAGAVAGKSTEKVLDYIESADDPEQAWIRSGLEIAIQSETFYKQTLKGGRTYDTKRVKREIRRYGELAQELAIRGDLECFEPEMIELLEDFADTCASLIDQPFGAGMEFDKQFEDELLPQIVTIKQEFYQ